MKSEETIMPEKTKHMLGIDAGTRAIKMVYASNGSIQRWCREHQGEPAKIFAEMMPFSGLESQITCMATGKYASLLGSELTIPNISHASVLVHALKERPVGDIRYIVDIGSSGLAMAEVQEGKLIRYETNSLCAAGTGAFLDQQMHRLGLGYEEVSAIPVVEEAPLIASRCSVFAKSDLIHRQQEGYGIAQLWNGLVRGLAQSAFATLFRGVRIDSDVMVVGGLAKNKVFLHYFETLLNGHRLVVPPRPDYFLAEGLHHAWRKIPANGHSPKPDMAAHVFEKPLTFPGRQEARHPQFIDKHNNEVDLFDWPDNHVLHAFMGVDVGSTSTKLVLLDSQGVLRLGLYTRTKGRPVEAFQRLMKGLDALCHTHQVELDVQGVGTTGSGRNLVGKFAGADLIKNEITAHLKGAVAELPGVKTIFEIGGQDAKYIQVDDGWMKDANMNYVCAAGTGSFLEEQARNLNIPLDHISLVCKDELPPATNHRCTVFMEQDAGQLLTKGMGKGQVMSSILYAVCKNYLQRVVQHRPVEEPILFLGATAKNTGLVEAFQHVLGKEIHTSPYSHLMGAMGMALHAKDEKPVKTSFRGLQLKDAQVKLLSERCVRCRNNCTISILESAGGHRIATWGYQCGREDDDMPAKPTAHLQAFGQMKKLLNHEMKPEKPRGRIFAPKVLHYYAYKSFWQYFFHHLSIDLDDIPSGEKTSLFASRYSLTDCCYPVKLAVGKVMEGLSQDLSPLFLPYHIQDEKNPKASNSFFCPLSQAFPPVMQSTMDLHGYEKKDLIAPVVDFSKEDDHNIRELHHQLSTHVHVSRKEVALAWHSARRFQQEQKALLKQHGREFVSRYQAKAGNSLEKPVFVILGRSYNLLDDMLNLDIPRTIAGYGYDVLPQDMLPVDRAGLPQGYQDMYWAYGQKIVVAARYLLQQPGFYPIFLSNFTCGPDSFLLSIFEREMRDKPALILELDEHGGDGGYLTRLEAFFDRATHHMKSAKQVQKPVPATFGKIVRRLHDQRVYIPPMHPIASRNMSAALRAHGIDSVALQREDNATYALGSSCVRGSECMPAASTIGSFIDHLHQEEKAGVKHDNAALFMPCTDGPCRFGQYARLHDQVLQRKGISAGIISPNSDDHYDDISGAMRLHLFKALMVSDLVDKLKNKIRPYEINKGDTDALINTFTERLEETFETKGSLVRVLRDLKKQLSQIEQRAGKKPLVGVVGEIYVRNSPFSNGHLVDTIEAAGGEAWVAPIMEWLHYTSGFAESQGIIDYLQNKVSDGVVHYFEQKYYRIAGNLLKDRREPSIKKVRELGAGYITDKIEGESILTIGRAIAFIEQGADLVVNVSPFGCMPGSISASILKNISRQYGVPIVSLFYDGDEDFSPVLKTYISNVQV